VERKGMIDLGEWNDCICQRYDNTQEACVNEQTIREEGKAVKLVPKNGEQMMAIVLDGCVFTDNHTKCDALFLHKGRLKHSFLVELKGAGDLPKAFEQLAYTRDHRPEYRTFINSFTDTDGQRVCEKFVIVSNGQMGKVEQAQLERDHQIIIRQILHCEATTPVPDLRKLI